MSNKPASYVGINNDNDGGMTSIGRIIRDAWVFGIIEETETCEGWIAARINSVMEKVNNEWDKYGCLVSNLPPELRERHKRIYDKAIADAKSAGWSGELETDDEN